MLGAEAKEGAAGGKQETDEAEGPQAVEVEEEEGPAAGEAAWHTGVCKWFNPSKGWGFINVTEVVQAESRGLGELSQKLKDTKIGGESVALDKDPDQKILEKAPENQLEEISPSGDIFVHQSTIQKEGFR